MLDFFYILILPNILYITTFWTISLSFYLLDKTLIKNGTIDKYKKFHKENKEINYNKIIKQILFNQIIGNTILVLPNYLLWENDYSIEIFYKENTLIEYILKFLLTYFIYDTMFYFLHRLSHTKKLYWIHKTHHEYSAQIALTTHYTSILEHMFINLLPSIIALRLAECNYYGIMLWTFIATLNSICSHSGYGTNTIITDNTHFYHHLYRNVNYGGSIIYDKLFNTYYNP